jgi:DNA-binding transcriptional ArsR family regulator
MKEKPTELSTEKSKSGPSSDSDPDNLLDSSKKRLPLEEIVIQDPDVVPVLYHPEKQQILRILMKQEKTLRELSDELQMNPGTVKRHLNDLEERKLIFLSNSIQNSYGIWQKYYQTTAQRFVVHLEFPPRSIEQKK